MIAAITGPIGAGKSTVLIRLRAALQERGRTCGGVITQRLYENNERIGYSLLCADGGLVRPLMLKADRITPDQEKDCLPFFCFRFFRQALAQGNAAIRAGLGADVLFIDEIGLWELDGGGWAQSLPLLHDRAGTAVLGLRSGIADALQERFQFSFAGLVEVAPGKADDAYVQLLRILDHQN